MQRVARVHDVIHTHIYIINSMQSNGMHLHLNFIFSFFGTPSMFSHIHYMNVNLVDLKDKGQGEVHTRTGHVGPEGEQRHSSTFSLTSALDVGGQSPCASRSTPGKETQCPLHKRLGGLRASLDG